MFAKNIFAGFGIKSGFVNLIYAELMKRELRGRILLYGENLEVISPLSLREQIKEILRRQMQQYSENK